jgi:Dehydratase family
VAVGGDAFGRTSGSLSILNASPEAAAGGGLAVLRDGDRIRIDLKAGTADILIPDEELAARRAALEKAGGFKYPPSQAATKSMQPQYRAPLARFVPLLLVRPPGNGAKSRNATKHSGLHRRGRGSYGLERQAEVGLMQRKSLLTILPYTQKAVFSPFICRYFTSVVSG